MQLQKCSDGHLAVTHARITKQNSTAIGGVVAELEFSRIDPVGGKTGSQAAGDTQFFPSLVAEEVRSRHISRAHQHLHRNYAHDPIVLPTLAPEMRHLHLSLGGLALLSPARGSRTSKNPEQLPSLRQIPLVEPL